MGYEGGWDTRVDGIREWMGYESKWDTRVDGIRG